MDMFFLSDCDNVAADSSFQISHDEMDEDPLAGYLVSFSISLNSRMGSKGCNVALKLAMPTGGWR